MDIKDKYVIADILWLMYELTILTTEEWWEMRWKRLYG